MVTAKFTTIRSVQKDPCDHATIENIHKLLSREVVTFV